MEIEPRFFDPKTAYVSSIPAEASERSDAPEADSKSENRAYFLNGEKVGLRYFSSSGALEIERSYRNGVQHGWEYRWDESGGLNSAEYYENGLPHGTFYQWEDGRLIGTYTMQHGAGLDLWREVLPDGGIGISEARYYQEGRFHGYEWWFHAKEGALWQETHWFRGERHGIEREWNGEKLSRDSPRYWVRDAKVTKAKYVRACVKDATLPPFRPDEQQAATRIPA